jgi:hypothetical protein
MEVQDLILAEEGGQGSIQANNQVNLILYLMNL